jgi:hypothetical protein
LAPRPEKADTRFDTLWFAPIFLPGREGSRMVSGRDLSAFAGGLASD